MIGTASSSPHTSHIQPQNSTDTKTAIVFNSPARPVSHGETRFPSSTATIVATPPPATVGPLSGNCRKAASVMSVTATDGPTNSSVLSTPAITPQTATW